MASADFGSHLFHRHSGLGGYVHGGHCRVRPVRRARGNAPRNVGISGFTPVGAHTLPRIWRWARRSGSSSSWRRGLYSPRSTCDRAVAAWPLLVLVPFAATPRLRRHWWVTGYERAPLGWSWSVRGDSGVLDHLPVLGFPAAQPDPADRGRHPPIPGSGLPTLTGRRGKEPHATGSARRWPGNPFTITGSATRTWR